MNIITYQLFMNERHFLQIPENQQIFNFTLVLAVDIPQNQRWAVANDSDPKWRAVKNKTEISVSFLKFLS